MKNLKIPKIAFAIADPKGYVAIWTIHEQRKETIKNFMFDKGYHINQWEEWEKEGWSVEKLDLSKISRFNKFITNAKKQ